MLRLPPFRYHAARSVAEAVRLLDREPTAMLVAGGTDLYANMKQRLFTPPLVVGLRSIPGLAAISYNEVTGLSIGALATLSDVAASDAVAKYYPALVEAALAISTPQLRNMGTIGGNVCLDTRCNYYNQNFDWRQALGFCMKKDGDICRVAPSSPKCVAVNSSDTAPVLWAYDGRIRLAGPAGEREVAVADFFRNDGIDAWAKRRDEIITHLLLPPPAAGTRSAYRKLRLRNSFDFPIFGAAVVVRRDEHGVCTAARLVINAVGSSPAQSDKAAQLLVGSRLEPDALDAAAEAAFAVGKPLDNTSGSIPYRKRMARVYTRRALEAVA